MKRRYTLSLVISLAVYVAFGLIGIYTYRYFQSNDKKKVEPKIIKIKMIELKNEPQKEIVVEKQTQEVEQSEPKKMLKPIHNTPQPLIEPLYPKVESKPKIEPKLPTPTPIVTPSVLTTQKPKSQTKEIAFAKNTSVAVTTNKITKIEPLKVEPKVVEVSKKVEEIKVNTKQIDDWKNDFKHRAKQKIESNKKYPLIAKNARITGKVKVSFVINKDGSASNIQTNEGNMLLRKSAMSAVSQSSPFGISDKFTQYLPMDMSVTLEFTLEPE